MLDRMLPLFHRYNSPRQQLSLHEGMIPTKNRLAIKQYICDNPVRASCCARPRRATFSTQKSTRAGSGTATGPSSDQLAVLSAISWRTRRSPTRTTAVHGPLLQLCRALPPAEERGGSPRRGHRHAKPQALPQGTRQEADRTWPVRTPVPESSVRHRREGPQDHALPEQLP